eukprot:5819600-Pyramimonas_sp.AAC.1
MIIVVYSSPQARMTFASMHAPHIRLGIKAVKNFWDEAEAMVITYKVDYMCVDANARVGDIETEWIGSEGMPQGQDRTGQCLQ